MIKIIDLHKNFGNQHVLRGINLNIEKGETVALIGASGKGKSVILKHIIGLMQPDQGQVLIQNQDIHRLRGKKLKQMKDKLGVVFQFGALFDSLTVFDNIAFPLREKTNYSEKVIKDTVYAELESLGLINEESKFPAQISGGMRKRVALARCLVLNPEIILFDEPTTGLDPIVANSIYRIIQKLQKERDLTSFIISHEIPGVFKIVNRVAMLHEGKIIAEGPTAEFQKSENKYVKSFLSGEIE